MDGCLTQGISALPVWNMNTMPCECAGKFISRVQIATRVTGFKALDLFQKGLEWEDMFSEINI